MASNGIEKRKAPRVDFSCEVQCDKLQRFSLNRITNISISGAWIEALNPPPAGTLLDLSFYVGPVQIRTEAEVVRVKPGNGMGVVFVNLDPRARQVIEGVISLAGSE